MGRRYIPTYHNSCDYRSMNRIEEISGVEVNTHVVVQIARESVYGYEYVCAAYRAACNVDHMIA